ncbi:MAG TPA: PH domain-containing protein [Acetobacteraceae bacterium]|nr:PH domain-containing protein [Acetobacteraceae bacterium]
MAYYTQVLQPDEKVLVVGQLHWSIYLRAAIVLLIAVAILVASFWLPTGDPDWQHYAQLAAAVVFLIGLLLLFAAWLRRRATEIVVTDRRVIFKRGFLSRHTVEMNISKIETVDVEQGLAGRIWGYGTLMIRGTGSGFEPLVGVGSPIAIRNAIVAG